MEFDGRKWAEVGGCTVSRTALTLAVITVVIGGDEGRVHVGGVRDGFAKAVSGKRHFDSRKVLSLGTFGEGRKSYLTVDLPWEMLSFLAGHNYFRRPHFYAGGPRYPVPLRHVRIGFGSFSRFHKSS